MQVHTRVGKQAGALTVDARKRASCKRTHYGLLCTGGGASLISIPSSVFFIPHTMTRTAKCQCLKFSGLQQSSRSAPVGGCQHHQLLSISATDAGELHAPSDFQAMASAAILSSDRSATAGMQAGQDLNGQALDGELHKQALIGKCSGERNC
eukprot:scaffold193629_cov19-Tisochrysis_lutea.AAC.1